MRVLTPGPGPTVLPTQGGQFGHGQGSGLGRGFLQRPKERSGRHDGDYQPPGRGCGVNAVAVLVVACLVAAGPSAIAARSPSPSPGSTEPPTATVRTYPDRDIAIAFPYGWDVTEFEVVGLPWALTAVGGRAYCELMDWSEYASLAEPALAVESLDTWLTASISRWDQDLTARNVTGALIDVPSGLAGHVAMDRLPADASSVGEPGASRDWATLEASDRYATYLVGDGERWFQLGCTAPLEEAPDDDWLSIAETFEFLPTKSVRP